MRTARRGMVGALACALALSAGCSSGGEDATAAPDPPTTRRSTVPPTTEDPVPAWCIDFLVAYRTTDMDGILAAAEAGAELDDPDIAGPSAAIVEALTWAETVTNGTLGPPPPPAQLTDSLMDLGFTCDPL